MRRVLIDNDDTTLRLRHDIGIMHLAARRTQPIAGEILRHRFQQPAAGACSNSGKP